MEALPRYSSGKNLELNTSVLKDACYLLTVPHTEIVLTRI